MSNELWAMSGECHSEQGEESRAGTLHETFAGCFTAFNMTLLCEHKCSVVATDANIPRRHSAQDDKIISDE